MTGRWAAAVALLALLLAWDDQRWARGEEQQRQADRPLSYREWSSQECGWECSDRQWWWRQQQEQRR